MKTFKKRRVDQRDPARHRAHCLDLRRAAASAKRAAVVAQATAGPDVLGNAFTREAARPVPIGILAAGRVFPIVRMVEKQQSAFFSLRWPPGAGGGLVRRERSPTDTRHEPPPAFQFKER